MIISNYIEKLHWLDGLQANLLNVNGLFSKKKKHTHTEKMHYPFTAIRDVKFTCWQNILGNIFEQQLNKFNIYCCKLNKVTN